jgi:hypothetical protein
MKITTKNGKLSVETDDHSDDPQGSATMINGKSKTFLVASENTTANVNGQACKVSVLAYFKNPEWTKRDDADLKAARKAGAL